MKPFNNVSDDLSDIPAPAVATPDPVPEQPAARV